ncbi:TspO/MBR family protein [Oxynema aestuarii]|uniref:TspO/MBR family protein n=1 Tax=Oxynema aestuarii AP17 TaxID=2064643 RepID=A0A6H1TSW6_9CYAN|nr:TspO/MBR family protein [Oxynema aestuarii]QIZ69237.1 TspO/MBR family protein [Oxynema aestuarii AP17]
MLKSWMVVAVVTLLVAIGGSSLNSSEDLRWFNRLRRPQWLTFEAAIPLIWTVIFICGAWSAVVTWESDPGTIKTWVLMGFYLGLEIVTISYTILLTKLRSLLVGTIVGATGTVLSALLAVSVWSVSQSAALLLVPYLLWSPIGTYTTWEMLKLNPPHR